MGAGVLQRHVGVGHAVVVVGGLRRADFLLRGEQGGVALHHEIGGTLAGLRHVLRHLAHAPLRRDVVLAHVFMQVAVEERKQRRLARAVASHQTHFFAWVQGDGGAVEQHFGAAAQRDVFQGDHRWRSVRVACGWGADSGQQHPAQARPHALAAKGGSVRAWQGVSRRP